MFIRRELGGTGTGCLFQFTYCVYYTLLCVHSSFAIMLNRKRCIATINALWLFLAVPEVGLQCLIVVFPDHTLLLFDPIVGTS